MDTDSFTADQRAALSDAGSYFPDMPAGDVHGNTLAAHHLDEITATALSRHDVNHLIDPGPSLDTRLAGRTLLSIPFEGAAVFPAFQFTNSGELPHRNTLRPLFRQGTNIVTISTFMTHPSCDLPANDGTGLTPNHRHTAGPGPGTRSRPHPPHIRPTNLNQTSSTRESD